MCGNGPDLRAVGGRIESAEIARLRAELEKVKAELEEYKFRLQSEYDWQYEYGNQADT